MVVGNRSSILVSLSVSSSIPTHFRPLNLHNILVTPQIIKNLISVHRFTKDNICSVEFDPYDFYVKDLLTKNILIRSDNDGDPCLLLPSLFKSSSPSFAFLSISPSVWHQPLGHTNNATLRLLISSHSVSCNKDRLIQCYNACQLGKQVKLPFQKSNSISSSPFELIHSDIWTSLITSLSGIRYYILFLDDYSHFLWIYPLCRKSELFPNFFTLLLMSKRNSTPKSKLFNAIMVVMSRWRNIMLFSSRCNVQLLFETIFLIFS